MKLRRKKRKIPKIYFIIGGVVIIIIAILVVKSLSGPPLEMDDLSYIMPGDSPPQYDVYRIVSVKKNVTRNELVGLMQYFTRAYLDKNRVLIYVFNNPAGAHAGESKFLVMRYFQDKEKKVYEREIMLGQPAPSQGM